MMARYGHKIADITNRLMKKSRRAIFPRNRDLYSVAVGLICEFKERAEKAEKELARLKRKAVGGDDCTVKVPFKRRSYSAKGKKVTGNA